MPQLQDVTGFMKGTCIAAVVSTTPLGISDRVSMSLFVSPEAIVSIPGIPAG